MSLIDNDPRRGALKALELKAGRHFVGVGAAHFCYYADIHPTTLQRFESVKRDNDPIPMWVDWMLLMLHLHPELRKNGKLALPFAEWGIAKGAQERLLGTDAAAALAAYAVPVDRFARHVGRRLEAVQRDLERPEKLRRSHRWVLWAYSRHPEARTIVDRPALPLETWTTRATPADPWAADDLLGDTSGTPT